MVHGGWEPEHEMPLLLTGPAQQASAPPGLLAQPDPPQAPHDLAQQAVPLAMPVAQLGSPAACWMTQGGSDPEQETLAVVMGPAQQALAPPGRAPQPEPPHDPQDAGQHTLPLGMPVAQVGSARAEATPSSTVA
jgi:hypothetical protein